MAEQVLAIDIAPTFLQLAGITVPSAMDGAVENGGSCTNFVLTYNRLPSQAQDKR
jgi:hypothetical protein